MTDTRPLHDPAALHAETALIDAYLTALIADPQAAPPVGLAPDLAQFIQTLVQAEVEAAPPAALDVQSRVWRNAYSAARVQQFRSAPRLPSVRQPLATLSQGATDMTAIPLRSPSIRSPRPSNLTLLAAAIAVIVIVGGLVGLSSLRQPPATLGSALQASASPTHTFTLLPNATPIGDWANAGMPSPTWVPTMPASIDPYTATPIPTEVPSGWAATPHMPFGDPTMAPPALNIPPDVADRALEIPLNHTVIDSLTPDKMWAAFRVTITEAGLLYAVGSSPNFTVFLSYSYVAPTLDGSSGGGGGGSTGANIMPSSEIVAYMQPGSVVTVVVVSNNSWQFGEFTLGVYFDKGRALRGENVNALTDSGTLTGSHPFNYFTFEGNPGTLISASAANSDGLDLTLALVEFSPVMMSSSVMVSGGQTGCLTNSPTLFCIDYDGGRGADPELSNVMLQTDFTYALLVFDQAMLLRTASPDLTGGYTINLTQTPPTPLGGVAVSLALNGQKRAQAVSLSGEAGQTYHIGAVVVRGATPVMMRVLQGGYTLLETPLTASENVYSVTAPINGEMVSIVYYPFAPIDAVAPVTVDIARK